MQIKPPFHIRAKALITCCVLAFGFVQAAFSEEISYKTSTQTLQPSRIDNPMQTTRLASSMSENQDFAPLESEITRIHKNLKLGALAVAIVDEEGPQWISLSGAMNPKTKQKTQQNTLFRIGDISKMFIGLAALKLVEEGRLDLNEKLTILAPELRFENPWHVSDPIRFVHLLEETTGWDGLHNAEHYSTLDNTIGLEQALNRYDRSRRSRWVPGTRWSSRSASPAVAAYIIEKITGQNYESYIENTFLKPIGMSDATFYLPDDVSKVLATSKKRGALPDEQYTYYRPINGLNASLDDMSIFLQFMIRRGKTESDRQQILQAESISRMEKPTTTLANKDGAMVGHGLSSSITGHADYGTPFYGYRGRLSELAYSPRLRKGFVVMATDNAKGIRIVARIIKTFLLQNTAKISLPDNVLPESFQNADGYYRRISGFSERDKYITELVGVLNVSTTETKMERRPLLGNFKTNDYFEGGEVLTNGWTGLPAIALVNDPLAGETLHAWVAFEKVSAFSVYGRLISLTFLTLFSVLSTLFMLFWLYQLVLGKLKLGASLSIRLWPSIASICMLYTLLGFYVVASPQSLGIISPASVSIYLASISYFTCAVIGVVEAVRIRKRQSIPAIYWPFTILSLLHLFFGLHLASFGLIGIQSWTV